MLWSTNTPWRALMVSSALVLAGCSSGGSDSDTSTPPTGSVPPPPPPPAVPPPPPPPPAPPISAGELLIETEEDAVRFLNIATFGATDSSVNALMGLSASQWVEAELAKPASLYLPKVNARIPAGQDANRDHLSDIGWESMIENDDQLRTRMTFALSQIVVANTDLRGPPDPLQGAFYVDALAQNAFGNYRQLIEDVTYTPMMARFLTYYRNRKGSMATGRTPDENYAREIMQLFTIGLVELNMDGTAKLDGSGQPIETYDNIDILGLARVFTGFSEKGSDFWNSDADGSYSSLVVYDSEHSELEKAFLDTVIPAGTPGEETVQIALDALFEHPNVAPFISRQLIQRFTSSNPPVDYIERVATAFENGSYQSLDGINFGTGQRGDLAATIAAILLDDYVFNEVLQDRDDYGKVREPVLSLIQWVRAFDVTGIDASAESILENANDPVNSIGQYPYHSESVFNFYRPGYVPPGTESGDRNMTVPEFQLVNDASSVGYMNVMTRFVFDDTFSTAGNTFVPVYTEEIALADDAAALADHLNLILTGGQMEDMTRQDIIDTLSNYPVEGDDTDEDRLRRVQTAILIAVSAPSYRIQR